MVTDSHYDAEGELLRRIHIDPGIPIAALDFHLGMSPELCGNATVVTGFRTYPHIDTYETAQRRGTPCGRLPVRSNRSSRGVLPRRIC